MHIWICNGCHAEIAEKKEPKVCPLCGQGNRGFDEAEKKEPNDEDKKYSKIYQDIIKDLEKYNDGCEPEKTSCSFDE
jgi:rubrerythrin